MAMRPVLCLFLILCTAGRMLPAEEQPAPPTPPPAPEPAETAETPTPAPAPTSGGIPPPAIRPFAPAATAGERTGVVEQSNGEKRTGRLSLTAGKSIRLLEINTKKYRDITFDTLQQIEVRVEFEKKQEEWSFKEGGNDEKIYSGNFYYDRRYQVRFTFLDGATQTGYVLGTVFYLTDAQNKKHRFFLHKDERGENKQEPKDLVYVTKVTFDPPAGAEIPPAEKKTPPPDAADPAAGAHAQP